MQDWLRNVHCVAAERDHTQQNKAQLNVDVAVSMDGNPSHERTLGLRNLPS